MPPTRDETLSLTDPAPRRSSARTPCLFRVLDATNPARGASRHVLQGLDEVRLVRGDEAPSREGAAPSASLTLQLPDPRVSSAHARLRCVYGRWLIEDLGSKNGTRVNGASIATRPLADGDLVELGHTFFVFRDALPFASEDAVDLALLPADVASGLATLVPDLARALATVARIAPSKVTVLVHGETGTGKEVAAQAIHRLSGRPGALVAVNCGALTQTLLEAELFGFRKGSFSGATEDRAGLVRAAHEGTLFLDEIGELAPASQVALLRVLQEGKVTPVGATRAVDVDLRVVAATHRPLEAMVAEGRFRRDLLARLSGFTLELPELRHRKEDLGLLIAALVDRGAPASSPPASLSPEATRALFAHDWPLNIRELEKTLLTARVLAADGAVSLEHLGVVGSVRAGGAPADAPGAHDALTPEDSELRGALSRALEAHRGNITAVARAMGKERVQIRRWLRRFALDPARFK